MFKKKKTHYLAIEKIVRDSYNKKYKAKAFKMRLAVGNAGAIHEYDIYEENTIVAGVSTSSWKNKSGTNNTGGQDRAAAELLWLNLWEGNEDRWHILTDKGMATNLYRKYQGTPFNNIVSIYYFNLKTKRFMLIGELVET
jgi:hypothetical protein